MSQTKATSDTTATDTEPVTFDTLSDVERGDVLIIEGERYPVYRLNDGLRSLFVPEHPEVVTDDGEVRAIAHGALSESDVGEPEDNPTALAWRDTIEADRDEEPDTDSIELLAANLDDVYVERQAADAYDLLPTHDSRQDCPSCESDTARYQYGRRDGSHVQEVRKCAGEDCNTVWCFDREIDTTTTAEVTTYDPSTGEYDSVELSGVFREIITSRFQLDLRSNAREGWFTAQEVADFLNPKMNEEKDGERFGHVSERSLPGGGVTWKDAQYDYNMEVSFRQISELSP